VKFSGWYSIVVGLIMLAQWGFFLGTEQVPEVQNAPVALAFHLAAEAATALALIGSGWAILRGKPWGRTAALVALGMLTYTVIVSPGYFAQQGAWPLVGMFALLLALALFSVRQLARASR